MRIWIQKADFTYDKDLEQNCDQAVELFESYDWKKALEHQSKLVQEEKQNCPPGMGVVHPKKGLAAYQTQPRREHLSYLTSVSKTPLDSFCKYSHPGK